MTVETKVTGIVIWIAVVASLAGLLFGIDIGVVNGSISLIQQDLHISLEQAEIITSILSIGALIGALFSGFITRWIGRKNALIISALIFIIFIIVAVTAPTYVILLLARFGLGLGVGLSSFVAPMYLSEMSPPKIRGALISLYQLMIVSGMFIVFTTNALLEPLHSWRLMFAVIFVPAVLMLISALFLPKSPRWLVLKGNESLAKKVLRKIRSTEEEINFEFSEIHDSLHYKSICERGRIFKCLSNKFFIKIVLVGIFLQLLQQFCGVNAIGYYSTYIFKLAQIHDPYIATIIMGGIKVAATVVAILLIDKLGRKPILYFGLIVSVLSTLFLGTAFYYLQLGYQTVLVHQVIFISSLTFQAGYSISLGPIVWTMCAEIFPLEFRDVGIATTTVTNWFGNAVLTRYVLSAIVVLGASYTFWIFGVICLVGMIILALYVPETKDIPLEELEMNLKDGVKLRYLGRRRT
ncbi:MAG: sugar porter family MFS transporter [Gammaproteobacteria bacterium]|jgi:SP family galactose:H+ symporter-like MFS transporter